MPQLALFHEAAIGWENQPLIKGLNWTIQEGEHWAVVGPTGSGKSLLLAVLANRRSVVSGTFQRQKEGVELVPIDFSFNRNVSATATFYQQRFNSYASEESPTVWEVLQEQVKPAGTVDAHSVELPPPLYDESYLLEVAGLLKVTHLLFRHVTSLSNGETRRTLLTRSFLKKPKVLLLDNPFIGLDVASRKILHENLNHIAESGTTLVLVAPASEIPAAVTDVLQLPEGKATPKSAFVPPVAHASGTDQLVLPPYEGKTWPAFDYAIRLRDVSIRYGETQILDHISWEVKRGEKWAVLGPNGSGKSTLLSLITADNPQAYANDFDLFDRKRGTGESIWDIKRNIGFVSPELHLYFPREQTVWKVIASGLFDTMGLFKQLKDHEKEYADRFLAAFRLGDFRDKRLAQLSTGQQRLVLLARALIKNPPLLILDEPCQGLDTDQMVLFRDTVDALSLHSDRTLLYVSHYSEEIPSCVTKTLRLEAGRRIE
ncbi:molybdate transport system ATP-binding protein [Siphonobacter aquaeclarae]|uniref:Molybdate transport system ATP-binding protein n=2 Tax=Siphonobacter aquaeclarae TaxID=563176 RepID=A0A1G9WDG3_9BACT|nr:molybdate transport system ATP-binding protein [Siphonobacter aquaeclarae]